MTPETAFVSRAPPSFASSFRRPRFAAWSAVGCPSRIASEGWTFRRSMPPSFIQRSSERLRWLSEIENPPSTDATPRTVSYTHLRAHETRHDLVCRLLLEKKKKQIEKTIIEYKEKDRYVNKDKLKNQK